LVRISWSIGWSFCGWSAFLGRVGLTPEKLPIQFSFLFSLFPLSIFSPEFSYAISPRSTSFLCGGSIRNKFPFPGPSSDPTGLNVFCGQGSLGDVPLQVGSFCSPSTPATPFPPCDCWETVVDCSPFRFFWRVFLFFQRILLYGTSLAGVFPCVFLAIFFFIEFFFPVSQLDYECFDAPNRCGWKTPLREFPIGFEFSLCSPGAVFSLFDSNQVPFPVSFFNPMCFSFPFFDGPSSALPDFSCDFFSQSGLDFFLPVTPLPPPLKPWRFRARSCPVKNSSFLPTCAS